MSNECPVCKCCSLLRGPKTLKFVERSTGCELNFEFDKVPQFEPIVIKEGEHTVEIYECHDVPGYKDAYVIVLQREDHHNGKNLPKEK
jgi:hypothetical protein